MHRQGGIQLTMSLHYHPIQNVLRGVVECLKYGQSPITDVGKLLFKI